jgi:predicted Fe-Mo cluster-binding NifX family protein
MKIVVTSTGNSLESEVDQRFGRAPYFIVYDIDEDAFSVIDNKQNIETASGAGIQSAQNIINSGAQTVITPNCGPKAFRVLSTAGIKVFSCKNGIIKDIIEDFKNGKLSEITQANVEGHWS